jgi:hypothetical protein
LLVQAAVVISEGHVPDLQTPAVCRHAGAAAHSNRGRSDGDHGSSLLSNTASTGCGIGSGGAFESACANTTKSRPKPSTPAAIDQERANRMQNSSVNEETSPASAPDAGGRGSYVTRSRRRNGNQETKTPSATRALLYGFAGLSHRLYSTS